MIVTISQTASNIKQSYTIEGENSYYQGHTGRFFRFQDIMLSGGNDTITGTFHLSKWFHYIPFRHLFGKETLTRGFRLYKNDTPYGDMAYLQHGFLKSLYVIHAHDGKTLHCYDRAISSFHYVSIYLGDEQIALIETYLNVNDYKYTHKLYLLDEYNEWSGILSFFILYYANYCFAKRFHMSKGSVIEKSWSFTAYNDKYDESWRESHFPNENFFGKINLFD